VYVIYRIREPGPIGFLGHLADSFVDLLILATVVMPLLLLVGYVVTRAVPATLRWPAELIELASWLLVALYTLFDVFFAATPGKMMVSLQIRTAAGARASRSRLLLRWAVKVSPLALTALAVPVRWLASRTSASGTSAPFAELGRAALLAERAGVFASYAVCAGLLLALLPGRRPLHDRIAGTGLFLTPEVGSGDDLAPGGFEVQLPSNRPPSAQA
jgi:hypothetical protein